MSGAETDEGDPKSTARNGYATGELLERGGCGGFVVEAGEEVEQANHF
jgi:hypothetical protein